MVLPGFATCDKSTVVMRQFLAAKGYDVEPWGLGRNYDHRTVGAKGEKIAQRMDEILARTGRKVSLIGWSLGGVIAREAARRDPQAVRQVITLGSPFGGNPHANAVKGLYELLSGNQASSEEFHERYAIGGTPLEVGSTAIFSKTDGIAAWENCLVHPHDMAENVEVNSSHFGLVNHPAVYHVIADRLAQPEGDWKPYKKPGILYGLY